MLVKQIKPHLCCISEVDSLFRGFQGGSYTDHGMQYNAYLMETKAGCMLFGSLPGRYTAQWLEAVKTAAGEKNIGWAVFLGTDGDHAAASALLREYPETVLIGSVKTLYGLEGAGSFRSIPVRTNRTFVFGEKALTFHVLADKHETPSIYVLDNEDGVLLTADAFGALCAPGGTLLSELSDRAVYWQGAERYYAGIFGSKRRKIMETAASLVRENGIKLICPACGPAVDAELEKLLSIYTAPAPAKPEQLTLAMVYTPAHSVGALAEQIAAGVQASGPIQVQAYDLSAVSRDTAVNALPMADAYLFGTAEVRSDAVKPIWDILTSLCGEDCKGKLSAVFHTSGMDSPAAENLRQRLAQLGCDLNLQDYFTQGTPDSQALKNAYEYGFNVGCSLQKIPNPHKPKLVKCLVCGEIFDASLGTCPVCGVGLDQCVPVDEDTVAFKNHTENRYLILGGGIAAVSAAEAIRSRDETGTITMLCAEPYLPINRPMLTKDLKTVAQAPQTLSVHSAAWYAERGISLRLGCKAAAIDLRTKTVVTESGETVPYDKLIYATGAECFVPPFAGHDKKGVLTIRHLSDSQEMQRLMETAKTAVVIGGGVLGLEAASELMRAGIQVTVLEATPQIIGRQADAESAAILKRIMEAMHVQCFEGVSIAAIEGGERANGVRLADGRVFPADLVVVSCGARGNVGPAKAAGIAVERAVVVNQRMETNVEDVYACGDCCQFDGVNFQLWQEASSQGRVAGANAAGEKVTYANQLLGLSLEGFGTVFYAIGDPGKKPDVPYKTVEVTDGVRNSREKYWFVGGALQGAVLIGVPEKVPQVSQAVTVHCRYDELF